MQTTSPRAFQLNNAFDVPFLMEMHDNDLLAISAILVTASQQISEELDRCMILAEKGDCNELKRRVHLVKPLWGFCGLPQMQMKYQLLEQFLGENPSIDKMRLRLQQEHSQIVEGLNLITTEALRIHEFLKQPAS
jgi:HPt (histidine-containing phosphotransfer) domain-containing protein